MRAPIDSCRFVVTAECDPVLHDPKFPAKDALGPWASSMEGPSGESM